MPAEKITRQEICVMIFRALDASLPSLDKDISGPFPFADSGQIASWAIDAMKFAYKNVIMKGTPDNKIAPLSNTTREQAIALLNRTYVKYRTSVTPVVQPPDLPTVRLTVPPTARQDTRKNFAWMISGNAFIPKYDQRLELFVSTLPGKPALKPVSPGLASAGIPKPMNGDRPLLAYNGNMLTDGLLGAIGTPGTTLTRPAPTAVPAPPVVPAPSGPYYTSAGAGAFVDQTGDRVRWFSFKLKNAPGAANVAWQVSTLPFNGATQNWKNPAGFVKSGQVAASAGEFTIDFGNLGSRFVSILTPGTGAYKPIAQGQKYYYIRAFPLDSAGNPIGEPGDGTPVIYGKPAVNKQSTPAPDKTCELWTPLRTHFGDYGAENNDKPAKYAEIGMSPDDTAQGKMFCFQNMDPAVSKVVIQVSDSAFPANDSWPTNTKLLYEKTYNAPVTDSAVPANVSRTTYPASVVVPFADFAMKSSEMTIDSHIYYYVRGVMVKPALTPGTVDVSFTNAIRVDYFKAQPLQLYMPPAPKYEYVNRSLPNIRMKAYAPVKWASQDYLQHYYIYRKPTAEDIKICWANTQTGEILYPYDDLFGKQYYSGQGIKSKQEYENIVIPRVLSENSTVYFVPPTPQDEAWYDELYDMVREFFEDLVYVASEIVNQVSSSYNNLKSALISYVVNLCPFDSLKGAFKTALEAMVNYGLVVVGLPPTLPNFDELSSMSLDYLAEVALTEAGIPATDLTIELTRKIAEGIGKEIVTAANHSDSNPVDAAFLKLDPAYSYRPAYIEVEFANPSQFATVPGSFNLEVTFEFDYYNKIANNMDPNDGISYSSPNPYIPGSAAGISTSLTYMNHFEYGLNGHTVNYAQGGKSIYNVFLPVVGQKVPILQPGEIRTVQIYLKPYALYGGGSFSRYPSGELVLTNDFDVMYSNGNKKFNNYYLTGFFPTPLEFMNSDGKSYIVTDPNTKMAYKYAGSTYDELKDTATAFNWSR